MGAAAGRQAHGRRCARRPGLAEAEHVKGGSCRAPRRGHHSPAKCTGLRSPSSAESTASLPLLAERPAQVAGHQCGDSAPATTDTARGEPQKSREPGAGHRRAAEVRMPCPIVLSLFPPSRRPRLSCCSSGHRPGTGHPASNGMGGGLRLLPDVALEALVSNGVLPAKGKWGRRESEAQP